MRIGVDARFLTHPQPGGFKTYAEGLIKALAEIDNVNQYIIYVDRDLAESDVPRADNFYYDVVSGTMPVLGMPVREQIGLRRAMQRDQLDVMHFLCNTATIYTRKNTIITLHDTIQVAFDEQLSLTNSLGKNKRLAIQTYSKWVILKSARSAQRIITVSKQEQAQISQHLRIPEERVVVTHLAAGPVFVPASPVQKLAWKLELQERFGLNGKLILGVGYEPRKNIPLLIEAFALLAPDHPDWQLAIVAGEPNRQKIFQQLLAKQHLSDRAVVLGRQSSSELAQLYNVADIFVFPSDYESFGLPPLEAMACGVPTIAMNSTSIPEIVEHGALLIDGKDAQTWANAIGKVLMDNDLSNQLVERGIRRASKFTWKRCAEKTLEVYQTVSECAVAY